MIVRGLGAMDRNTGSRGTITPIQPSSTAIELPVTILPTTPQASSVPTPSVLQSAANAFAKAGIASTCANINTNNQGGNFNQGVCTVAGSQQVYDAGLTTALSTDGIRAVLAREFAVEGQPSIVSTPPAGPLSTQQFSSPSNTQIGASVTAVPSSPVSQYPIALLNTPTTPQQTVQPSVVQNSVTQTPTAVIHSVVTPLDTPVVATNLTTNVATSANSIATSGPGISYNDINPDGTAVQSTASGMLTDAFAVLDAGISIGGVNVPVWLIAALGLGGWWIYNSNKTPAFVGGRLAR